MGVAAGRSKNLDLRAEELHAALQVRYHTGYFLYRPWILSCFLMKKCFIRNWRVHYQNNAGKRMCHVSS